ncbi:MAG: filamentous hemagglutinin N-terminal domain-containing protein [Cyanobacteria bacterium P01_B01_bin.77]
MKFAQSTGWIQACMFLLTGSLIGPFQGAMAQILPDNTLLDESSMVKSGAEVRGLPAELIEGGAQRDSNLFHSFFEFNVDAGQRVYFANPLETERIFSRVTGGNPSAIDGLLGVNGPASLFFLNPNGVMFGPEASLDVLGSFVVSTAEGFRFEDSSEFRAIESGDSSLLTVSVPLGLQVGPEPRDGSVISSEGSLAAGQDLVLFADEVDLQGQVISGGDLNLLGTDTVRIRDSETVPFIAVSGGGLLVQGDERVDIFVLGHPESGLFAGSNLVLSSDRPIIGDAHFYTNGDLEIKDLSNLSQSLVSPTDPIILARGNIDLGDYEGASLHILAGGSVTLGNVTVDRPGPVESTINSRNNNPINTDNPTGTRFRDLATFEVPDYRIIKNTDGTVGRLPIRTQITINGNIQPTLDVRAGVDWNALGGLLTSPIVEGNFIPEPTFPGNTPNIQPTSDITILGDIRLEQPDSLVVITNQYQPNNDLVSGSISTRRIDTSTDIENENGGDIYIYSQEDITINLSRIELNDAEKSLDSSTVSFFGQGGSSGDIRIFSESGNITIDGGIDSSSLSIAASAGSGGDIILASQYGDITVTDNNVVSGVRSFSFTDGGRNADKGGDIIFSSETGNITTNTGLNSVSLGNTGADLGGDIFLFSRSGDITTNGLLGAASTAISGNANRGGDLVLSSQFGNITTNSGIGSGSGTNSGNAGKGGNILLSSQFGNVTTNGFIGTGSGAVSGDSDKSGDITLSSEFGNIITNGDINSFSNSTSGNSGNGGDIILSSEFGNIVANADLRSFSNSNSGKAGSGGPISLIARNGSVQGNNSQLLSVAIAQGRTARNGGTITIEAKSELSALDILTLSSAGQSGVVKIDGFGDLLIQDVNLITSARVEISNPLNPDENIILDTSQFGQSGDVSIIGTDNLTFNNVQILSDANGTEAAGNINIFSPDLITFEDSIINSNTNSTGNAGNIDVVADGSIRLIGQLSQFLAQTSNAGKPGNININTPNLFLSDTARITATSLENSTNLEEGGSITISADQMNLAGIVGIFAETQSQSPGGRLTLQPYRENFDLDVTNPNLDVMFAPGARISASTTSSGSGGDLQVQAPESITISGQGQLAVETSGTGRAGTITFNTNNLVLQDGLIVSAASSGGPGGNISIENTDTVYIDNSVVTSEILEGKNPSIQGGDVRISATDIRITNDSELRASTNGAGNAGNVIIENANNVLFDNSVASSESGPGDITENIVSGDGQNVQVQARNLQLINGSELRSISTSQGDAGNVILKIDENFQAIDGSVRTNSENTSGGIIDIEADVIRLRGDSDITTFVNDGEGGGGNIDITSDSVIAFDDSDILAFSIDGRGGNVTIDAPYFFGDSFEPAPPNTDPRTLDNNDRVDVNASGAVDGVISIPDVSFVQNSLTELPDALVDPNVLTAGSCIARTEESVGSFTTTGTDGLPQRPSDTAGSQFPAVEIEPLTDENTPIVWRPDEPIVEPNAVYQFADGRFLMGRKCS